VKRGVATVLLLVLYRQVYVHLSYTILLIFVATAIGISMTVLPHIHCSDDL